MVKSCDDHGKGDVAAELRIRPCVAAPTINVLGIPEKKEVRMSYCELCEDWSGN